MGGHLPTVKRRNRKRVLPSIVGTTFKHLKILQERSHKQPTGKTLFEVLALCACGVQKWVDERSVRRGKVTSCGRCSMLTHGGSRTPEYAVWRSMLQRCHNPNHKAYANYGGRGIAACPRWRVFENFYADMGAQPFKGASLERVDNNKGYTPENCIWANASQQAINRRSNKTLTIDGVTKTYSQWAKHAGIGTNTLSYRLTHNWDPKKAVFTKPNFANKGATT